MQNHFLIKRSPSFSNNGLIEKKNQKNKAFSETIFTESKKEPLPKELQVGDLIYVAEKDWGIYAKGKVSSIGPVIQCTSLEEMLAFASTRKPKDEVYWQEKMERFYTKHHVEKKPSLRFKFQEYFIDQKLLDRPLPLLGGLARLSQPGLASAIIKLTPEEVAFIQKPSYSKENFALSPSIPYALKLDIYGFFNTNLAVQHFIDIDHFVPKSAGGPGNIVENLVPIGLGLNRYKSNSIPRGFFVEAAKHAELNALVNSKFTTHKSDFIADKEAIHDALFINKKIADWKDIDEIRAFYRAVLSHHFVDYVRILDDYRAIRGY